MAALNWFLLSSGRCSSIGSVSAWHARSPEFDPSGTFSRGDLVMKTFLRPISLPLIQEEQLSVTGKRMGTKYW